MNRGVSRKLKEVKLQWEVKVKVDLGDALAGVADIILIVIVLLSSGN
jgi:hypothetical protein